MRRAAVLFLIGLPLLLYPTLKANAQLDVMDGDTVIQANGSTCAFKSTSDSGGDSSVVPEGSQPLVFEPEIIIPLFGTSVPITGTTALEYIRSIFVLFIWAVGILAVVMITFGGVRWVAAAGNPTSINAAKEIITNSVIGLIIALTTVVLLNVINPDLVSMPGLSVRPVSACLVKLLQEATEASGGVATSCNGITAAYTGSPDQVCFEDSTKPCVSGLNDMIDKAADFTAANGSEVKVDPVALKSLILKESYRRNGNPISGPAHVKACTKNTPNCQRLSSSYGLGQAIHSTMIAAWEKVSGRAAIPAACTGDSSNWRQASGSLSTACANYLDNNIPLQLKIMAAIIDEAQAHACVKNSPTLLAAAYHLGSADFSKYCAGQLPDWATKDSVGAYLRDFNTIYTQQCEAGSRAYNQTQSQVDRPVGGH
jgi:hypothetical protein